MTIRVESGDCLEVIPRLLAEGVVVDSVVCDPPYHLLPTAKRFGPGQKAAQGGKDGSYQRLSGGFMNQIWDGGDVAFRPETWATVATILRPGGFLLAFGGTRTSHRVICAIEDAGFVIQDKIFWCFGSGFPKRRDMLKPAYEDICAAYKPGGKRTLQVDECRIEAEKRPAFEYFETGSKRGYDGGIKGSAQISQHNLGRWPANLCHDGSAEVMEAFAAFDAPGQQRYVGPEHGKRDHVNCYGDWNERPPTFPIGDSGSPARFFYCAKADADDRFGSRHPTIKPVELLKWLVPLVTPKGGLVLDCFAGSGTTGVAALATGRNAILIEREPQYIADIRERLAHYSGDGRHSLAARNRNAKPQEALPLFAEVAAE